MDGAAGAAHVAVRKLEAERRAGADDGDAVLEADHLLRALERDEARRQRVAEQPVVDPPAGLGLRERLRRYDLVSGDARVEAGDRQQHGRHARLDRHQWHEAVARAMRAIRLRPILHRLHLHAKPSLERVERVRVVVALHAHDRGPRRCGLRDRCRRRRPGGGRGRHQGEHMS